MIDIFKIYKQYYQRSYRYPSNLFFEEMKNLSHDLVKKMYLNRYDARKLEVFRIYGIELAKKLIQMERDARVGTFFGRNLLNGLEKNEYEINVTYPVARRWSTSEIHGEVYILTSPNFLNSCKLGATTLEISERVRKFENRYGYPVTLFYSIEIISPFYFEKYIEDTIKAKKIFSRSQEHTNEWYSISPIDMQLIIEREVGNFLKYIKECQAHN